MPCGGNQAGDPRYSPRWRPSNSECMRPRGRSPRRTTAVPKLGKGTGPGGDRRMMHARPARTTSTSGLIASLRWSRPVVLCVSLHYDNVYWLCTGGFEKIHYGQLAHFATW